MPLIPVSDQPGRYFAVFVLCPALIAMGVAVLRHAKARHAVGKALVAIGVAFFMYELSWIRRPARTGVFDPSTWSIQPSGGGCTDANSLAATE